MPDIIEEIKEDIKHEKYNKLWQEYGNYIIGGAFTIVLITSAFVGWKSYNISKYEKQGSELYHAFLDEKSSDADYSIERYSTISQKVSEGYSAMASFRQASILVAEDKVNEALEVYKKISSNKSFPKEFRDLSTLLELYNSVGDNKSSDLLQRIKLFSESEGAFKHSAKELLAFYYLEEGHNDNAKEVFNELTQDTNTPAKMKQRSIEMLSAIKSKGENGNG